MKSRKSSYVPMERFKIMQTFRFLSKRGGISSSRALLIRIERATFENASSGDRISPQYSFGGRKRLKIPESRVIYRGRLPVKAVKGGHNITPGYTGYPGTVQKLYIKI